MIRNIFLSVLTFWVFFYVTPAPILAQLPNLTDRLAAHFDFDNYPITDRSGSGNKALVGADSVLECGVSGNALRFDGVRSELFFLGPMLDEFKSGDFSISFYMKATQAVSGSAAFDILSKKTGCHPDSTGFAIRYTPSANQMSVELVESKTQRTTLIARLDFNRCWQHIVVIRSNNRLSLYVNGRLAGTTLANKRLIISNSVPLKISGGPCIGSTDRRFGGFIDEFRVYARVLNETEVQQLFTRPDRIANRDTIIFLGSTVNIGITATCARDFKWLPTDGVSDANIGTPAIKPTRAGNLRYTVAMKEAQCSALDTIDIRVIDPDSLGCGSVFLPKAFTPNGNGPGQNEKFALSNPYAIDELIIFEIFDAWGTRLFSSVDKFESWDGKLNGSPLNPGVYVWKVKYKCNAQEFSNFGSVTILR
jgi:gliding motility-associated-like protein